MNATFEIDILYTQIAIFDATLSKPYNSWSKAHLLQGFSWRQGSVSFATIDDGPFQVRTYSTDRAPEASSQAIRIIRVPFQSSSGIIEIGSVMVTQKLSLDATPHNLWFIMSPADTDNHVALIELVFSPPFEFGPAIIKQDSLLNPAIPLIMQAVPA
jgi:hypothetical protein